MRGGGAEWESEREREGKEGGSERESESERSSEERMRMETNAS